MTDVKLPPPEHCALNDEVLTFPPSEQTANSSPPILIVASPHRFFGYHGVVDLGAERVRYRCLILDHDDTAVDATRSVHHPAHCRAMEILRPQLEPADLETWFAKNFDPGIIEYLQGELGFSAGELEIEHQIWREFTHESCPPFYPGFLEALRAFRQHGGLIVVASHSEEPVIRAHYKAACNGALVEPDLVFGWDLGVEKRKPNPFPVSETLRILKLRADEVLVVDDLKPGVDMAKAAGVDVAAAGWGHNIPVIENFMKSNCVATFPKVADFADFILRGP